MKVAFIGHRKIIQTNALKESLTKLIEELIVNENAEAFIFGSRSEFENLCYEIVTELKGRYNHIRRILVRAEYEHVDKLYKDYLLTFYEDTFYPTEVLGAGVAVYVKRNQVMVDISEVLVTYCDENYIPDTKTKSGTKLAVEYAQRKKKRIINVFKTSLA